MAKIRGLLWPVVALLVVNGLLEMRQASLLQEVASHTASTVYVDNWPASLDVQVKNDAPIPVEVHPEMSRAVMDSNGVTTLVDSSPVSLPVVIKPY